MMGSFSYPAKLLLFGEYAVVCGGEGLAIPYTTFSARWAVKPPHDNPHKEHLMSFLGYLKTNAFPFLDLQMFEHDLAKGLTLVSDIPIGYGVGSSGAVVAAVYDRYARQKKHTQELQELIAELRLMENYFHHKSSGLDPLVSYLNMPIYVKGNAVEHIYNVPQHQSISYTLCDTGISRFTNSLVSHFNLLCCENNYQKLLQDTYLPLVSSCIQSYLKQDTQALVTSLKNVSAFQFTHFAFAIPASVKNAWAESLAGGDKIYKLCGAGGGGYVLIFSVHDEFEVNG